MHIMAGFCVLMTVLAFLAGCAPAQEADLPPLTIEPPPTLTFAGDCNVDRDLADWLEYSTFYAGEFVELVSAAAAKSAAEMYDDVALMGRMRADFSGVAAPDCAQAAQELMVGAMSRAVDGFQSFINRENSSLGSTVADTLGQFDRVIALQNELMSRLEAQLQEP
jgi:hypothetical protein